jgi:hypothetical protein
MADAEVFAQIQSISSAFSAIASPVLSRVRFSEIVGVVTGWCNKGLIETFKIGKHSLINMEALRRQCGQRSLG